MFFKAHIKKRLTDFDLDISIEIDKEEYTAILGPSGAGKSMTLKIIAGIEPSEYQYILLEDINISELPPEKRKIVYLTQKDSLFPHMNVFENIVFPFIARGVKIDQNLLDKVIDTFKIRPLLHRLTKHLSGGEARRVALARAICAKPKVLLLDEPLSFLDFHIRLELIDFLKKIPQAYGTSIIHVTHDPIEACLLSHRIYILKRGKIASCIKPNLDSAQLINIVSKISPLIEALK
ncbi:MAG: ABC transporter ATP-binding protein [Deltaproteobacteria bacterium]|nr:MAG: ABC transporter ATP-binding protein [Deltaproteobacteria bacterium]